MMIYLKKFESSSFLTKGTEFVEMSKSYLVFLIDEGLKFGTDQRILNDRHALYINLYLPNMLWENIKDTIIPYIEIISNDYTFNKDNYKKEINISYADGPEKSYKTDGYSVQDIIDDNLSFGPFHGDSEENYYIYNISFRIVF